MQISILLMKQILELFLMIFMGYVIVKTGLLKDEDSKVISKIVLYLIIPCVIINAFQVEYTDDKVKGLFLALVASVLLLLNCWKNIRNVRKIYNQFWNLSKTNMNIIKNMSKIKIFRKQYSMRCVKRIFYIFEKRLIKFLRYLQMI